MANPAHTPIAAAAGARRLRRPWPALAQIGLVALALIGANLLAYKLRQPGYSLDVGTRPDRALVLGFHGNERDSAGTTYRWTAGPAELRLAGPATTAPTILRLDLGWLPPGAGDERALALSFDGAPGPTISARNQPRHYLLLLPPQALADGELALGMRSETTLAPGDPRPVGVRLDGAALGWSATAWPLPAPVALLAQAGLLLAWLALARGLGLGAPATYTVALALTGGLAAITATEPALAAIWQLRLFWGGLACAALVAGAGALLPRALPESSAWFIRAALLITLAALAARLLGALHPSFFAHDLLVNGRRLNNVQIGVLELFDRPSEFSRRISTVSPTTFILILPLTLLADRTLALHSFYSFLDGMLPLLVAVLARRLGLSERAAILAAALMAWLPMQFVALYWGFVKQIVGNALSLLLLVAAAGPPPRRRAGWLALGLLALLTFLTHNGVLLLIGICLGLFVALGLAARLLAPAPGWGRRIGWAWAGEGAAGWRGWLAVLLGSSLAALAIQYAEALRLMVGGLLDGSTATTDSTNQLTDRAALLNQIWVGLNASFAPLPLALVAAGLAALAWRASGPRRLLVIAWAATALLFLAVDLLTGLQVRYGYFVAPLACAGVAALAEPLLRHPAGRAAAWALAALVLAVGLSAWLGGALGGVKISVNAMTH